MRRTVHRLLNRWPTQNNSLAWSSGGRSPAGGQFLSSDRIVHRRRLAARSNLFQLGLIYDGYVLTAAGSGLAGVVVKFRYCQPPPGGSRPQRGRTNAVWLMCKLNRFDTDAIGSLICWRVENELKFTSLSLEIRLKVLVIYLEN